MPHGRPLDSSFLSLEQRAEMVDALIRAQMREQYPGDARIYHHTVALAQEAIQAGSAERLWQISGSVLSLPRPRMFADPSVASTVYAQTYDTTKARVAEMHRRLVSPSRLALGNVPSIVESESHTLQMMLQSMAMSQEDAHDVLYRRLGAARAHAMGLGRVVVL